MSFIVASMPTESNISQMNFCLGAIHSNVMWEQCIVCRVNCGRDKSCFLSFKSHRIFWTKGQPINESGNFLKTKNIEQNPHSVPLNWQPQDNWGMAPKSKQRNPSKIVAKSHQSQSKFNSIFHGWKTCGRAKLKVEMRLPSVTQSTPSEPDGTIVNFNSSLVFGSVYGVWVLIQWKSNRYSARKWGT